jgi:hypothetical protein
MSLRVKRDERVDQPAGTVTVALTWEGITGEHGVRVRIEEAGQGDLMLYVEIGEAVPDPQRPTVIRLNAK